MKCPKCSFNNQTGSKLCNGCGNKLEITCPRCGKANQPGSKFCNECGQNLNSIIKNRSIDFEEPKNYTPRHLADKILNTRSTIEGERKLVTVLFADIANFTSISEKLDPEEVHQIMDECFKILMTEIHKYEGTINQFTGDGVMALFGAPIAHEAHAQCSCHAALSIQKAMKKYGNRIKNSIGIEFKMRIGINSGLVIVGAIGEDLRMDYTAVGDTTNLSARMESLAEPGTILTTQNTFNLVREYFEFKALGNKSIKGKAVPVETYQLLAANHVVNRFEAAALRGLTSYSGRLKELSVLENATRKIRTGNGRVVGISGEPGVGKSRLVHELKNRLRNEFTIYEGCCVRFGGTIAFRPFQDILRSLFDVSYTDLSQKALPKIAAKLKALNMATEESLSICQDLLAMPVVNTAWQNLSPTERKEKTFVLIRDILLRTGDTKPLLVVIDDLHWIDKTSEEFLGNLINKLDKAAVMLLLLYRPEYRHTWKNRLCYRQISLTPLPTETAEELIGSIFENVKVTPKLNRFIIDRSSGNPLFIEELIHTLLAKDAIMKDRNKYIIDEEIAIKYVPESIHDIIASRIDRLDENHKYVIQLAAVIGRDFVYGIIRTIMDSQIDLEAYLDNLQDMELIFQKQLFPELAYTFKHVLIQEVAYNSILLQKRNIYHEQVADAIEQLNADRVEEFYEMLAHHYDHSNNSKKAHKYLRLSGEKAIRNHFVWEAYDYFKKSIKALDRLSDKEDSRHRKLELLNMMIIPIVALGLPKDSLDFLKQGLRLSQTLGERKSMIRFFGNIGMYYTNHGKTGKGIDYTKKAFETAENIRDLDSIAQTGPDLCLAYLNAGSYTQAINVGSRVIRAVEGSGRRSDYFGGMTNIYSVVTSFTGFCVGMLGDFSKALSTCDKALDFADRYGGPESVGLCEYNIGAVNLVKGNIERACKYLKKGVANLEQANFFWHLSMCLSMLGLSELFKGNKRIALGHMQSALRKYGQTGTGWRLSVQYLNLGICRFSFGEFGKAENMMHKALVASKEAGEKHVTGKTLIWLCRISLKVHPSEIKTAALFIRQGIKLLKDIGARPDLALGYLFLGRLLEKTGEKEKALDYLDQADKLFRQMGIKSYAKETQAVIHRITLK